MDNKIINFGSLNIDHVYAVPYIARAGETIASTHYSRLAGGKGLNQSIALARAGAVVVHAGKIGPDGGWLRNRLWENGVKVEFVVEGLEPTGYAIIQIDPSGQNSIIVSGGANLALHTSQIALVNDSIVPGDWLLAQNEINSLDAIIETARRQGATIVLNPAPMNPQIRELPLELIDIFILNESEAAMLSGEEEPNRALLALRERYTRARIVITLGENGAIYADPKLMLKQPAFRVSAVDTTAAGDTFIGYFIAALFSGASVQIALKRGCKAASICVTRKGAADSIPYGEEVRTG